MNTHHNTIAVGHLAVLNIGVNRVRGVPEVPENFSGIQLDDQREKKICIMKQDICNLVLPFSFHHMK